MNRQYRYWKSQYVHLLHFLSYFIFATTLGMNCFEENNFKCSARHNFMSDSGLARDTVGCICNIPSNESKMTELDGTWQKDMQRWNDEIRSCSFFFSHFRRMRKHEKQCPTYFQSYNTCLQIAKAGKQVPLCWCLAIHVTKVKKADRWCENPLNNQIKMSDFIFFFNAIRWHYQHNCAANTANTACVYVKYEYGCAQIKTYKGPHISACECIYIKNKWKAVCSETDYHRIKAAQIK